MAVEESKIKYLIREYLLEEGLLRQNLPDSEQKLEFGFRFVFPPTPIGQNMIALKPKNKNLIVISNPIQISPEHVTALNALKTNKKMRFFMDLRKFFLVKDVFFRIDIQNYRYEISDQIFLNDDNLISKNDFFKSIRKVFTCSAYSNMILNEYCSSTMKPEDFPKSKDFNSNFSLYS
ncbi:MAG: DUF2299 family protein [Candidatus Thorarchaeota archaeon]